ncbi:hypothetical protein F5Y16DRAFT_137441 [Xylariaceae sp. FL0255]|nr:hypothetical protein F5Y16DRAFT_137441 [Xylariaceae sp. FL0255]
MADEPPGADKTLLERLNALKPTSLSLTDPSSSASGSAGTIERAKPPSKEDALSARLKSLRNQDTNSGASTPSVPRVQRPDVKETSQPLNHNEDTAAVTERNPRNTYKSPGPLEDGEDTDDPLYTDDQTLEELLADLRSDDSWLDELAAEEELHQKTTAMLNELGKSINKGESSRDCATSHVSGSEEAEAEGDDGSDDESDGEAMTRETDAVIAKAMDEVEWEKANKPASPPPRSPDIAREEAHSNENTVSADQGKRQSKDDDPFNLPAVPSDLQDQPDIPPQPTPESQSDTDFAASIASRMAALKLTPIPRELPSVPTAALDSLGLPFVPTFSPADRPVPGIAKRTGPGLSDEDQKTWCVVCLDDGAIRCLGCEDGDNVYCARCWKEMHVGPSAGYEERGHSWENFRRR